MLDKAIYIKSRVWEQDTYLTVPANGTATKICRVCKRNQFTTEFSDDPQYPDNKEPVCYDCIKQGQKWRITAVSENEPIDGAENQQKAMMDVFAPYFGGVSWPS